ncbi:NADPH:quinone reductase-like protein [Teratosphaeria nubilosa]|uniref:NADPH:quinone reductase-like protein n=1 Tax=Teratosphaeria nubilosa TaxID=161662 RepID=A0A6G1KVS6_9PEZI|nr:NADPH:quinone reductase-like protein [Teratosphaeria nubilosa]
MAQPSIPGTIQAWQYTTNSGPLERRLHLNTVAPPNPNPDQHLIRICYAAVNPVDYKVAEVPLYGRFATNPKPATPGIDYSGILLRPAAGSALKPGQKVIGAAGTSPFAGGAFREIAIAKNNGTVALPEGVSLEDGATVGVAGLTAYQSIVPHVKAGSKLLILGGSGGTGIFGIQIAKIVGCEVTVTCSTANVELCKSLGADEVINYKTQDVLTALARKGQHFDHVVDNVGGDLNIFFQAHRYTRPGAGYVYVAGTPSIAFVLGMLRVALPTWLGGPQRKFIGIFCEARIDEAEQIAQWMKEGKIRPVIDSRFEFDSVPKAIERSKTGRARGKIVIKVAGEVNQ